MVLAMVTPPPAAPYAAEALVAELADIVSSHQHDHLPVAALKSLFDAWASAPRPPEITVHWNEVEGSEAAIVEARGRRADFVVIARPTEADDAPTRHAFQAALFRTERPVLVVPAGKSAPFGRRVAIAWRDDIRTAKALIPALRLLGDAEQVHLLAGVREGTAPPMVPAVLSDHGVSATLHILPIDQPPFGRAVLEKLHQLGADLLVMGAYAHTPLHRIVFGGVTRYMLDHADVPVLMRH